MPNGMYTNSELIDSVIGDLNKFLQDCFSGQYVFACSRVTQISQKLVNLRTSIDRDMKSKDEHIERLKESLRSLDSESVDVPVESLRLEKNIKDGADNGGN